MDGFACEPSQAGFGNDLYSFPPAARGKPNLGTFQSGKV